MMEANDIEFVLAGGAPPDGNCTTNDFRIANEEES
jgi:hypothetical protein